MTEELTPRYKIVVVGDGAAGKTSLLQRFAENTFSAEYTPTIFENRTKHIEIDGKRIELALWDTAGQEEYDQIRILAYKNVDMILLLFSFDLQFSLQNCSERWIEEIRQYNGNVPVILVAAKSDLKGEKDAVSVDDAIQTQIDIKAAAFIECSSKTGDNVDEVFIRATRIIQAGPSREKNTKCVDLSAMKSACSIQ